MIKVCYVAHAHEYPIIAQVAKLLKEKGVEFCFVCKDPQGTDFYIKRGFKSINIAAEIFNDKTIITDKEKEELDLKYGPPGIREICDSDVHLRGLFGENHNAKEQIVAKSIRFWEDFFEKNNIDHLITLETATFATRPAYLVSQKRHIPIIQISAGLDDGHFFMNDVGETIVWKELVDSLNDKNKLVSQKEKEIVSDFITKRIYKKNKIPMFFVPDSFFNSMKNLVGLWLGDNYENRRKNPIGVAAMNFGRRRLWEKIKWSYFTRHFFNYDKFQKSDKYVYFPIFSRKETTYLSNDIYYSENEVSLIKEVARSLPLGFFLYVKEHPFNPGDLTFSELKELKKVPNIKVFHPSVSSQELIDNGAAVVTVEGTAGWEGFLSKKPVICISGMTFYAYSSLVYKVKDIRELPTMLWKAIRNGSKIYEQNKEEWIWFIYKSISSCGIGAIYELNSPYINEKNENSKNIAESIFKKITRNLSK